MTDKQPERAQVGSSQADSSTNSKVIKDRCRMVEHKSSDGFGREKGGRLKAAIEASLENGQDMDQGPEKFPRDNNLSLISRCCGLENIFELTARVGLGGCQIRRAYQRTGHKFPRSTKISGLNQIFEGNAFGSGSKMP